jgi:hypothetical protein
MRGAQPSALQITNNAVADEVHLVGVGVPMRHEEAGAGRKRPIEACPPCSVEKDTASQGHLGAPVGRAEPRDHQRWQRRRKRIGWRLDCH